LTSFCSSAQPLLHALSPGLQVTLHCPPTHAALPFAVGEAQVRPHAPQLATSFCSLTQVLLQSVKFGAQTPMAH
jgi:hypothetical protein